MVVPEGEKWRAAACEATSRQRLRSEGAEITLDLWRFARRFSPPPCPGDQHSVYVTLELQVETNRHEERWTWNAQEMIVHTAVCKCDVDGNIGSGKL